MVLPAKSLHLISGMVMRFKGSTRSILGIMSLAPGDKCDGRLYMPPAKDTGKQILTSAEHQNQ